MKHIDHCPHCGVSLEAPKRGKPRSVPQHRRYFALVRAAWMHWPEKHNFRPQSEEHLRRWLQAKSGHREVVTIDTLEMTPAQAVSAVAGAMRNAGPYAFVSNVETKLYVVTSKSVSFDDLPHISACALFDAVAEVIEVETGIKADEMISHTPRKTSRESLIDGVMS